MQIGFPTVTDTDPVAFARDMQLPKAQTQYVVFFTPRSGSTWLTDLAIQTGRLGYPVESFDPFTLEEMALDLNAGSLRDYCEVLPRKRVTNGVAGFEITHHQLRVVFRSDDQFRAFFPDPRVFWLIRKDILAQAVSLHKMTSVKVAHATLLTPQEIAAREAKFSYDADRIAHWINHIHVAEQRTEALFAAAGWHPMRLSYEQNVDMGANAVLNSMARFLSLGDVQTGDAPVTGHQKLANGKNAEFAARFAAERPDYVEEVAAQRATSLEKLAPYDQQLRQLMARADAA